MKRLQKHMHTRYVYLAVGLFFVLRQLFSLQMIDINTTISNELNYLLVMALILTILPMILLVVIYLPASWIVTISNRQFTFQPTTRQSVQIQYPTIQFHNTKQQKQYTLQVFRC